MTVTISRRKKNLANKKPGIRDKCDYTEITYYNDTQNIYVNNCLSALNAVTRSLVDRPIMVQWFVRHDGPIELFLVPASAP